MHVQLWNHSLLYWKFVWRCGLIANNKKHTLNIHTVQGWCNTTNEKVTNSMHNKLVTTRSSIDLFILGITFFMWPMYFLHTSGSSRTSWSHTLPQWGSLDVSDLSGIPSENPRRSQWGWDQGLRQVFETMRSAPPRNSPVSTYLCA